MTSIRRTGLLFVITIGALALAVGPVAGADATVTFDDSATVDDGSATIDLVATGAPDTGVGAYNVTLIHDASAELSVSETDRFDIVTSQNASSGTVATTLVGYTGSASGSSGTVSLADLTVTLDDGDSVKIAVSKVSTLADIEGVAIDATAGNGVTIEADDGDEADDTDDVNVIGGGDFEIGTTTTAGGQGPAEPIEPTPPPEETTTTATTTETTVEETTSPETATTTMPTVRKATSSSGPGFQTLAAIAAMLAVGLLGLRRR